MRVLLSGIVAGLTGGFVLIGATISNGSLLFAGVLTFWSGKRRSATATAAEPLVAWRIRSESLEWLERMLPRRPARFLA